MSALDLFYPARTTSSQRNLSIFSLLTLHRSRRALAQLDARQLADVGISEQNARAEAAQPVWNVPKNWRI
ncbi:DUF1127 domain-containing protein [Algirhabdus cladophorae]|uniref:DUF1127 domain-containing protein n=1 Tax=Algirhabdus cladophorae TaxID=3377108 RepID=UPI003B8495D5